MKLWKLFIKIGLIIFVSTSIFILCKTKSTLNNDTGSTSSATVGGYVVGLDVGKQVTLRLNGSESKNVAYSTGFDAFTFSTTLSTGNTYLVEISDQTTNRVCTPGGNSGNISSSNIGSVTISCVIPSGGSAGFTYFPTTALSTSENGTTAGFAVWLNSQPTAPVTIGLSSSNLAEGTVSPATLTFTSVNWGAPQWVTITGVDDLATPLQDGSVIYNIITTPDTTTIDLNYKNLTPALVSVTNLDNDTAGIYVSPTTGLSVSEVGSATFTVVLTSQPYGTITMPLNSTLGGANGEATYSPASLTFNSVCPGATCWSTPHTVTINGVNDAIADGNKVFTITSNALTSTAIFPPDSGYVGKQLGVGPMPLVSVTSIDVGAPGITVTPINTTTSEAGPTTGSFTVVLNTQPTANVIVPISASASAAGEGNIISPFVGSGNLTFTAGTCPSMGNWCIPQTVVVSGLDDTPPVADGNKPFTIYVGKDATNLIGTAVSGAAEYVPINPPDVNFTNLDNETASVVFGISSNSVLYTTESTGTSHTATFDVRLSSAPISGTVTVGFNMSIAAQATLSTVALPVGAPTTSLTFTSATYNIPQTVTITSIDDTLPDGAVGYQVQVNSITGDPGVGVNYYNNLSLLPLKVNVIDFDNDSPGVTYTQVTCPSFNEAAGTATFTTKLNSSLQAGKMVQIDFNATASGGRATVTPSVSFNDALCPGVGCWNVPQTITVTGVDNTVVDGNLNFSLLTTINVATTDTNYAGLGALPSVNGTVVDNEVAGITVSACGADTTTEGGVPPANQCTFTVSLNQDPGVANTVTVPLYSDDTTEGIIGVASVSFTGGVCPGVGNWCTAQPVTVTGIDDYLVDGNVIYHIITQPATSTNASYAGLNAVDVLLRNIDNDAAGVNLSTVVFSTTEGGSPVQVQVTIPSQPTGNVVIPVANIGPDLTEGNVAPASLTFTPTNWFSPQMITVTPTNDTVIDPDVVYTVQLGNVTSTDAAYNALTFYNITVTNINNDKKIFSTIAGTTGAFGVIAAADNFCMTDAGYPGTGTYKALLTDGVNRIPVIKAWVLKPNATYYRINGTTIIQTTDNDGLMPFPLINSVDILGFQNWTGLSAVWQAATSTAAGNGNCSLWTSGAGGQGGYGGTDNLSTTGAISSNNINCNNTLGFYCVEQ